MLKLSRDQKQQLVAARNKYLSTLGPVLDRQHALLSTLEVVPSSPLFNDIHTTPLLRTSAHFTWAKSSAPNLLLQEITMSAFCEQANLLGSLAFTD